MGAVELRSREWEGPRGERCKDGFWFSGFSTEGCGDLYEGRETGKGGVPGGSDEFDQAGMYRSGWGGESEAVVSLALGPCRQRAKGDERFWWQGLGGEEDRSGQRR